MERVYRDERFPDLEIRHSGGSTYNIWVRGEAPHGYHGENGRWNMDCFTCYPPKGCPNCSHDGYGTCAIHAEETASRHFDEMAEDLAQEAEDYHQDLLRED